MRAACFGGRQVCNKCFSIAVAFFLPSFLLWAVQTAHAVNGERDTSDVAEAPAEAVRKEAVKQRPPRDGFERIQQRLGFFPKNSSLNVEFGSHRGVDLIDLDKIEMPLKSRSGAKSNAKQNDAEESAKVPAEPKDRLANPANENAASQIQGDGATKEEQRGRLRTPGVVFWGEKNENHEYLPPDQNEKVRVNPEAPSSIISMKDAYERGDMVMARQYARQFVRLMQNYQFEVRLMTQLILQAWIDEKAIDDEEAVGVTQMIDIELAKTRQELGAVIKPTQEVAMRRIKPDPKNEVEIYYFFSMNCSWCRYMAPDVERLWRAVKDDPRVKMVGLTMGSFTEEWLKDYRDYTGLSAPVFDGTEVAQQFKLAFVPAIVIIAPNGKRAYMKSGQQSFERMYEFVRTAQGLPAVSTPQLDQLVRAPIGRVEEQAAAEKGKSIQVADKSRSHGIVPVSTTKVSSVEVDRF